MLTLLYRSVQSYFENPENPIDEEEAEEELYGSTDAGVKVTRERVLGHPTVWGAISKISRSIAMLPVDIYRKKGKDENVDEKHPLHQILTMRPDVELTPFALKQKITHDAFFGNAYVYIWRDGNGRPTGVWPLNPEVTCSVRDNNRLWYGTVLPISNKVRRLDPANVIHIKGLSWDAIEGYDVLRILRNAFALPMGQRKYRAIYFKNNGKPNLALEAPPELEDDARDRLIKNWKKAGSGLHNAHKAVLLEQGVKVHEYGSNAKESQLLDAEEHEIVQIANVFGMPPSWLGAKTNVSYKSLEQDTKLYMNCAVLPWVVHFEEEFQWNLLSTAEI